MLSLGLNFCTDQHIDTFEVVKDLNLFSRNLLLKVMYGKDSNDTSVPDTSTLSNPSPRDPLDEEILELLQSLLDESQSPDPSSAPSQAPP